MKKMNMVAVDFGQLSKINKYLSNKNYEMVAERLREICCDSSENFASFKEHIMYVMMFRSQSVGAILNHCFAEGRTLLHMAFLTYANAKLRGNNIRNIAEKISLLISNGAVNLDKVDNHGKTPVDYLFDKFRLKEHEKIASILSKDKVLNLYTDELMRHERDRMVDKLSSKIVPEFSRIKNIFKTIIAKGLDSSSCLENLINMRKTYGYTPLHLLAISLPEEKRLENGTLERMNLSQLFRCFKLSDSNVQISAYNILGFRNTPLHAMIVNESTRGAKLFLRIFAKKINYSVQDVLGKTTCVLAASCLNTEIVKEIISAAGNLTPALIKDDQGLDAIDYAIIMGNLPLLKFLQKNIKSRAAASIIRTKAKRCLQISQTRTEGLLHRVSMNPQRHFKAENNKQVATRQEDTLIAHIFKGRKEIKALYLKTSRVINNNHYSSFKSCGPVSSEEEEGSLESSDMNLEETLLRKIM